MNENTKRYILTGTPGSGKTTLIRYLETKGYFVVNEAATDVITLSQALGLDEPWKSPVSFLNQILFLQNQRQIQANEIKTGIQFFDRSPFCTQALCNWCLNESSFDIPELLKRELDRVIRNKIFDNKAFFIENLGFVQQTGARRIQLEEALRFEKMHEEVYRSFGFELIRISPRSLVERGDEILKMTQSNIS